MAKLSVYQAAGFRLLSELAASGGRSISAANVNIAKGDYMTPASGHATNANAAFQINQFGIAAEPVDNSGNAAGTLNVLIIPLLHQYQWSVPVEANTVILRTHVGDVYDLESVNTIDLADSAIAVGILGFFIDDFDASAEAVAANTYGYAIGHFQIEE